MTITFDRKGGENEKRNELSEYKHYNATICKKCQIFKSSKEITPICQFHFLFFYFVVNFASFESMNNI